MPPALSTEERAAVVAAVLSCGEGAPEVLSRLSSSSAERCVEWTRALLELSKEERIRVVVAEVKELTAEIPVGFARIHPSWIEAALEGEGDDARRVVAGGGKMPPRVRVWLRRRVLGHLVGMESDGELARLLSKRAEALVDRFVALGRRRLAQAVQAAPRGALGALAARLGPEHGPSFAEEARAPAAREDIRAAVRELSDLLGERFSDPTEFLFRAGCRYLIPALLAVSPDAPRQLAQHLPFPKGQTLLALTPNTPAAPTPALLTHLQGTE